MSIQLKSVAGSTIATIGATSKAIRITNYDSGGNVLNKIPTGSYLAPVSIRHTAADAVDSCVWHMRNNDTSQTSSPLVVHIRAINLIFGFDGTAATNTVRYALHRSFAATPTGGTAVTVIKKKTSYAASVVGDIRGNAVLTFSAGVSNSFEGGTASPSAISIFGNPISVTNAVCSYMMQINNPNETLECIELQPGEGLGIRLAVAAVAGQMLSGYIEWDER